MQLNMSLSGRLQGMCYAICRLVHGLPFARLCRVVVRCKCGVSGHACIQKAPSASSLYLHRLECANGGRRLICNKRCLGSLPALEV